MKRLLVLLMLLVAGNCAAQSGNPEAKPQEPAIYKFEFTAYELQNAKRTNVRNYSMMLKEDTWGETRTGNRIPVPAKEGIQYMDVGLFIRCRFLEKNGAALLNLTFDMTNLVAPEQAADTRLNSPVIRSLRQESSPLVLQGKPVLVASIDDTNSPRTVQLEVTATKLK